MGNVYRLVGLKNSELLAGLSALVQRSQQITAEELAHLAEIEDRMLHLELGFASLFAYCVEALGMSEGSAGRRVAAARVCRRFPGAFEQVARGDLHLSALCALSPHLKAENAGELFDVCRRKTRRQTEELLAARFPRADVREQIRRLPVGAQGAPAVSASEPLPRAAAKVEEAEIGSNRGHEAVETPLAATSPAAAAWTESSPVRTETPRRREIEALSVDRFGVHFTADAELCDLIEQARALASHRLAKGDLASLMKLALKTFVQHEEKRRFAVGSKLRKVRGNAKPDGTPATAPPGASELPAGARSTPPGGVSARPPSLGGARSTPPGGVSARPPSLGGTRSTPPGGASALPIAPAHRFSRIEERTRYVPAPVKRKVYLRDQGRCSFVSTGGRRCEARAFLQLDHIEPWAALGAPVVNNIRVLCRAHNLLHARNCFGKRHVAARIAARRCAANLVLEHRREVYR